jgi:putative DNA primase/helicase
MIRLAKSEEGIPVMPDDLDKDPWLITCLNGTIDLKSGILLPPDRDHLITKGAPVNFDPNADCPQWKAHLELIMDGNQHLIAFLQRAYGSCLTGDTRDRKVFIAYGAGKNGKSICQDTIAEALGDYAMRTPTEGLLTKRGDSIPNDIARLKGARFVYASEVDQGRRLSESLIKDLSGGEKISARFMRGEWFEFRPEFKLWLGTNHKPVIKETNHAIWDRIALIPFSVRISDEIKRPRSEILAGFKKEMPGILAWLVRGCLLWQLEGLGEPPEIKRATREYRNEMDVLGDFISEMCITGPGMEVTSADLNKAYENWCDENGEKMFSKIAMGAYLKERGFEQKRGHGGKRKWVGLGLKS